MKEMEKTLGEMKKMLEKQKIAEEQERLRKIQEEMEKEKKMKEEEERKKKQEEEERKLWVLFLIGGKIFYEVLLAGKLKWK